MKTIVKHSWHISQRSVALVSTGIIILFILIALVIANRRHSDNESIAYTNLSGAYCFRYPTSWTLATYIDADQEIPNLRDPLAMQEGVTYHELEKLRDGIYMEIAANVPMAGQERMDMYTPDGALADDLIHDRQLAYSARRTIGGESGIVADIDPSERSKQAGGVSAMYRSIAYIRNKGTLYYVLAFFFSPQTRQRHAKEFGKILSTLSFREDCMKYSVLYHL